MARAAGPGRPPPDAAAGASGGQLGHQAHVVGRHQAIDVDQHQHAVLDRAEADQVVGADGAAHVGRRLDLVRRQRDHVRHAVDHHPDGTAGNVEDDHHSQVVVGGLAQLQLDAHVDDGHDDAAQIDHALDVRQRIGNAGNWLIGADFLHFLDVDSVLFFAQLKREEFRRANVCVGRRVRSNHSQCHLVTPYFSIRQYSIATQYILLKGTEYFFFEII